MFKFIFSFITSLFQFSTQAHAICPDASANETSLDCPWAEVTRMTSTLTNATEIKTVIESQIPGFLNQLTEDRHSKDILELWGLSKNTDESHPNDFIIPTNLLSVFAEKLGVTAIDPTFKIGHAGMNHTYGYLFSNLQTPFGYKRARYVQGEIEKGFGIPVGLFGGMPTSGTLLSNLTYFIGTIALQNFQKVKTKSLPLELKNYDYRSLKVTRLIEAVKTNSGSLELRTDIIPFVNAPVETGKNSALLIYSIKEKNAKLITAFPVQQGFVDALFAPALMGENQNIKLKYNAAIQSVIPTDPQGFWQGTRSLKEMRIDTK